jgi:hypothetical protein
VKSFGYYDLIEAFAQPGCAFCRLSAREARRYLDSLLYEYVAKPETQNAFRASRGLCRAHGWALTEVRDGALGIAILYEQALDETLRSLGALDETRPRAGGWRGRGGPAMPDALAPDAPCPCCVHVEAYEGRLLRDVLDGLDDVRFSEAFAQSSGFCLPHLMRIVGEAREPSHIAQLTTTQRAIWRRLQADLLTFIDKQGTRAGDNAFDPMGSEADSPRRALRALSGLEAEAAVPPPSKRARKGQG